jgi:hypothetical protein
MRARRILIAIWVFLGLLVIVSGGNGGLNDPGWAEVFLFFVPLYAFLAALVGGLVLAVFCPWPRVGTLGKLAAIAIGAVIAPIASLLFAFVAAEPLLGVPWLGQRFGIGLLEWVALWWPMTIALVIVATLMWLLQDPPAPDTRRVAPRGPGRTEADGGDADGAPTPTLPPAPRRVRAPKRAR